MRWMEFHHGLLAALTAGLAVLGGPLVAQTVSDDTAVIEGVVTDESGAALSGVHVAVRSPEDDLERALDTRADGSYGLAGLPPGTYSVEVWIEGYSSAIAEDVGLDAGETLRLDFTLAPGAGIAITVIASPRIDVASPSRTLRMASERLDQLPGWLRFAELARLVDPLADLPVPREGLEPVREGVPAVELRGRPMSKGPLWIDGIETGGEGPPLELDSAQVFGRALEVGAGGLRATLAGAPGGVLRLTPSATIGTTRWRVGVDLGTGLEGGSEPTAEGSSLAGVETVREMEDHGDLAASLGGSVLGGRLRLFAAGIGRSFELAQRLAGDARVAQELDETAATLRLGAAPRSSVRVGATVARAEIESQGLLADVAALPQAALASGGSGRRESRHAAFSADLGVGARFHLHAWAGWLDRLRRDPADEGGRLLILDSGRGIGLAEQPEIGVLDAGFATGKPGLAEDAERAGRSLRLHATRLAGGGHRLGFGVERSRSELTLQRVLRGTRTEVAWERDALDRLGTRFDLAATLQGSIEREGAALFVEDQWRLSRRFTLRLGLRAESDRVTTPDGAVEIDRDFEDGVEPRFGAAWDVLGDGNYVIYLSADRYHRPLGDRLAIAALGEVELTRSFSRLRSLEDLGEATGSAIPLAGLASPVRIDPGLAAERWRHFSLGSEQLVIPGLRVRAEASYRELERGVALVFADAAGGGPETAAVLANPGRGLARRPYGETAPEHPGMASRRLALETGVDVRIGPWTAGGSYTYSESEGNVDDGSSPFELSASLAAFGPAGADLLPAPGCARLEGCFTTDGSPATDRPLDDRRHRWKVYGSWALPHGFDLGAYFQYLSGAPTTPRIGVLSESDGILVPVGAVAVAGAAGGGVGDSVSQLDLEARWRIAAGPFAQEGRSLSLFVLVSNVLDQSHALSRWDRLTLEPIVVPREAFFTGFDALALAEQQGAAPDPRFGEPRLVQRAREARLGIRLAF